MLNCNSFLLSAVLYLYDCCTLLTYTDVPCILRNLIYDHKAKSDNTTEATDAHFFFQKLDSTHRFFKVKVSADEFDSCE